jgi:hypothetical protein
METRVKDVLCSLEQINAGDESIRAQRAAPEKRQMAPSSSRSGPVRGSALARPVDRRPAQRPARPGSEPRGRRSTRRPCDRAGRRSRPRGRPTKGQPAVPMPAATSQAATEDWPSPFQKDSAESAPESLPRSGKRSRRGLYGARGGERTRVSIGCPPGHRRTIWRLLSRKWRARTRPSAGTTGDGGAAGLDRGGQLRKLPRPTRESRGELCTLAVALHRLFFKRLNPRAIRQARQSRKGAP